MKKCNVELSRMIASINIQEPIVQTLRAIVDPE